MNNNGYYQNPIFTGSGLDNSTALNQQTVSSYENSQIEINPVSMEQSYIENILRLNRGKKAKLYVTIPGADEYKIFEGIIEQAGRDHIIVSNPNGEWYLILMIYLDFVTFDEPINFLRDFK